MLLAPVEAADAAAPHPDQSLIHHTEGSTVKAEPALNFYLCWCVCIL